MIESMLNIDAKSNDYLMIFLLIIRCVYKHHTQNSVDTKGEYGMELINLFFRMSSSKNVQFFHAFPRLC